MRVQIIECRNSYRNLNYLIINEAEKAAICIDPFDAGQIKAELDDNGVNLKFIINTHEHWDHTKGNKSLKELYDCKILNCGGIDSTDQILKDGDRIPFGKWTLEAKVTPGHTMQHISILLRDEEKPFALFSGDTLFNAGVGNCHNGGHPEVLFETFENFYKELAGEIIIYPGHDYIENNLEFAYSRNPSNRDFVGIKQKILDAKSREEIYILNMQEERKINPFLRLEDVEIQNNLPNPTKNIKSVFLQLRELRNKW